MNETQAITEFGKNVQQVYPDARIYKFVPMEGSPPEEWDYNMLVVLNEVNTITYETVYEIAWQVGSKHDTFLSPLLTKKDKPPIYLPHFF